MPPFTLIQLGAKIKYQKKYKKIYLPYNKISPYVKYAVIVAEDATFEKHTGFNWDGIERAIHYNKKNPRRIRGASTISQQVAKNVFLWNGRTWIRKALEVYFTTMIEWMWGKKRILEIYLNIIEMGPGIIGIEAASLHFYGKHSSDLNIQEAATIASCLPNPKILSPLTPTPTLKRKIKNVIRDINVVMEDPEMIDLIKSK